MNRHVSKMEIKKKSQGKDKSNYSSEFALVITKIRVILFKLNFSFKFKYECIEFQHTLPYEISFSLVILYIRNDC